MGAGMKMLFGLFEPVWTDTIWLLVSDVIVCIWTDALHIGWVWSECARI